MNTVGNTYIHRRFSENIRRLIFISLCILFLSMNPPCLTAKANDLFALETQGQEQLESGIREQIDKLDLEALQSYLDELNGAGVADVGERILAYIKGGKFEYSGFWKQLSSVLFAKIEDVLPAFLCITAVTLLSGLISLMKATANMQTSTEMISLVTFISVLIPLISVLTNCFNETMDSVNAMQKQMQIFYPLMLTLMATSGGTLSASVCRPAVAFFSTSIVSLIRSVIFPITITILVFSMAGNLSSELKIGKFTSFFKSINKWLIGVSVSVFGLFFSLQGITAASYDGVVKRAVKYAIGNGIPIVGGFLSGGFDLAVASSVLIKNSLGSMSIFLMITVLFEPLVLLIAVNLLLRITAAITQPFGDNRISDFLEETAENLNYCTAGLLFTAFLYFLSIMLMISSTEVLF